MYLLMDTYECEPILISKDFRKLIEFLEEGGQLDDAFIENREEVYGKDWKQKIKTDRKLFNEIYLDLYRIYEIDEI